MGWAFSLAGHLFACVLLLWLARDPPAPNSATRPREVHFRVAPPIVIEPPAPVLRPPAARTVSEPPPLPQPTVGAAAALGAEPPVADGLPPPVSEPPLDSGGGAASVEPNRPTERPPEGAPPPESRDSLDLANALASFRPTLLDHAGRQPGHGRGTGGGSGSGGGTTAHALEFGSLDYDLTDYKRLIEQILLRAFNRRLDQSVEQIRLWAYRTGRRGISPDQVTSFSFAVERNGSVTGVRIEGSSGCEPLDRIYVDALAEVVLPPLPSDFPRDRELWQARWGFGNAVAIFGDGGGPATLRPVPR